MNSQVTIAIPCLNEAVTIGGVVQEFQQELPQARILVFDNGSTDSTAEIARKAGAEVIYSPLPGKGSVVQHIFSSVQAGILVIVDGDETYPAERVHSLLQEIRSNSADMAVGTRLTHFEKSSFRFFHLAGNRIISLIVRTLFNTNVTDVLSGYRAFSERFRKIISVTSEGFEIETELTLRAIIGRLPIREVPISYRNRPAGSRSKLNTFRDGFLILKFILGVFAAHFFPVFSETRRATQYK